MNKKTIIILSAILAAVLLGVGIFFLVTNGTTEKKDGLLQNSRVYIENIYIEDRTVYYTVVNKRYERVFTSDKPYVYKRVNGAWEMVTLWGRQYDLACVAGAFDSRQGSFEIEYPENLSTGEYRLVFGDFRWTNGELIPYGEGPFIVGDFTVTAPLVMEYGQFEEKDGILQNSHVTLTLDTTELNAPVNKLSYTLHDDSDFYVEYEWHAVASDFKDLLEIYVDGVWKQAPTFGEILVDRDGPYTFTEQDPYAREDYQLGMNFWKPYQIEGGEPTLMGKRYLALTPGQYRLRVKYTLHTEDENVEIPEGQLEAVAYFTVTAPAE